MILDFTIRPIQKNDLEQIMQLALLNGVGMTSLPGDLDLLKQKIQKSLNAFAIEVNKPGDEYYSFVLELKSSKRIIGIASIGAKVGGYEPFYSYMIKHAQHQSPELGIYKKIPYLELTEEHDGPSIISSLFVLPEYRGYKFGKALTMARLFFIANFPQRFTSQIIAEMRGIINSKNQSPFWDATVKHFFDMDFAKADYLTAKDKKFIADLIPKYPIYIPLLSQEARESIGQVHQDTQTALKSLQDEGFVFDSHVDIFDAGPRLIAEKSKIQSIQNSKVATVCKISASINSEKVFFISNTKLDFRLSLDKAIIEGDSIQISEACAKKLQVKTTDKVRYL